MPLDPIYRVQDKLLDPLVFFLFSKTDFLHHHHIFFYFAVLLSSTRVQVILLYLLLSSVQWYIHEDHPLAQICNLLQGAQQLRCLSLPIPGHRVLPVLVDPQGQAVNAMSQDHLLTHRILPGEENKRPLP